MTRFNITYPLLLGLFLLIISALQALAANSPTLSVEQHWFSDPSQTLNAEQAASRFANDQGIPLEHDVFQLGNEQKTAWIQITIRNAGTHPQDLRLLTGTPYSRLLKAQLLRSKANVTPHSPQLLIDEHEQRPFSTRNNHYRLLNSNTFTLATGESAQILIQTTVEGPSYLPFSVLTEQEFTEHQLKDSIFSALFYGFSITLGLLFLLFALAVRHHIAILYATLYLLGILAMADIDGYAFQWLWPNYPAWNHFSPIVVLPIMNALGFFIIHQLLESTENKWLLKLKPWLLGLIAISLGIPLLLPILSFSTLIQMENLLSIPAFLLQPIAFTSWLHLGRRNIGSLLALLIISLAVSLLVLTVFVDVGLPNLMLEHIHHFAYLIVGLMVMGIITLQLMGLHKDQQTALKNELELAKQNAQMNKALFKAEQNYSRARELASKHKQQLASASHDLRQPIVSLRSSFDAIALNQPKETRQQIQQAFNYLEQLCNQHLAVTRPTDTSENVESPKPVTESYPASLILGTVQRMFAKEAANRGIKLRKVDCSALLDIEPLGLMRIVSNLVANAIKHHPGGDKAKVLLGCRRKETGLELLICDNGAGMTEEELRKLQQPYQKGENSEGEGLGLAIIQQEAEAANLTIKIQSKPGEGSCFVINC